MQLLTTYSHVTELQNPPRNFPPATFSSCIFLRHFFLPSFFIPMTKYSLDIFLLHFFIILPGQFPPDIKSSWFYFRFSRTFSSWYRILLHIISSWTYSSRYKILLNIISSSTFSSCIKYSPGHFPPIL